MGTQQPARPGDSDGMWLGYRLTPAAGDVAIGVTFSESMGSNEVGLIWAVFSGVDTELPVDAFEDPGIRGDVAGHTFAPTP